MTPIFGGYGDRIIVLVYTKFRCFISNIKDVIEKYVRLDLSANVATRRTLWS